MTTHVRVPTFHALVPLIHVANVSRSIGFYQSLGFRVTNAFTPADQATPSFVRLDSGGAHLMLVHGTSINPDEQGVILTLYCDDVAATHAALQAAGVGVGEIGYPPERPNGRFRCADPDGYDLAVTHV